MIKKYKVHITGWNGFLATKLRQYLTKFPSDVFELTSSTLDYDIYFDLGSTISTQTPIPKDICKKINRETISKIEMYDQIPKNIPIIFGSSTGVLTLYNKDDESSCYDVCKMMLENWITYFKDSYLILRIDNIYSLDISDYSFMKKDRVPSRVYHNSLTKEDIHQLNIIDTYLETNNFLIETIFEIEKFILTRESKVYTYKNIEELTLLDLIKLLKR